MKKSPLTHLPYLPTKALKCCFVLSVTLLSPLSVSNENLISENHFVLDKAKKKQVISSIASELEQSYVFPDKGQQIADELRSLYKNNHFSAITDTNEFSKTLTDKLQQFSHDKHLQVAFNAVSKPLKESPESVAAMKKQELEMWQAHNFGFEKFERLPFNIGYFKLTAFGPTPEVGPLIASVMNLLNNSDSLVIDLRGNFGGEEQTVSLLASYFLEQRTHLLNMYKRQGDKIEQHWSSDYVQGARYAADKPVYILIDNNSFSAAEDFSYTMKHLKRATLIGETTGGAANSGDFVQLTSHFSMFIPTGRGTNPITKTNWEGTGVVPDITVTAQKALQKAQQVILNKLLTDEKSESRKKRILRRLSEL